MDELNKQDPLPPATASMPTADGVTFSDLGLPEEVLRALRKALPQITQPTPIQAKAIPLALAGKDIIGSARTGTGKTFAFCLPLLASLLDDDNNESQAFILTPTRELAAQTESVLQPLLRALHLPRPCLLIGGVSFGPQMAALRARPRVVVATPGRLLDHMESGRINPELVKVLVLDEADRMLDMGFLPQVRAVCKDLSPARQTFLFTATLPKEIRALAREFMNEPESIFVDPPTSASQQVTQQKVAVGDDKKGALLDAVNAHDGSILVFARTRRRTDHVARYLQEYGVRVESIHGDRSQHQRLRAIESFRSGRARVLVATDIAARGLDIPQVGLVINFDLPETKED
ncbi:MAG: DEAD/DEAH box helicase, partial [Bdellovibrionales bacterium]|nr:DEAD/DEAH box helicase [Bdellovibrionales bacterium]